MKTSTVFALVASAEVASATFNWGGVKPFTCPGNTPVTCEETQKGGFNWGGLDLGDFSSFGDFKFSGFKVAAKFGAGVKRDQLTGRTFQEKCIVGSAGPDKSTSPKFSCDKAKVPKFSVDVMHVTPEFDCDLQFHYTMPDKSTCKQTSKCQKSGTVVKNTQCGGATDVTIVYPGGGKGKPNKCNVGVHHIGFHCEGPKPKPSKTKTINTYPVTKPTKPASTPSVSIPVSSPPAGTTSVEVPGTTATPTSYPVGETTSAPAESTSVPVEVPGTTASSSVPVGETTSAPVESTSVPVEVPGTTATPTSFPVGETTAQSSPPATTYPPNDVTTTVIHDTTLSTCPFTSTHVTSGTTSIETGTTISTIVITSTHTTCNKCTGVPTTTPVGEAPGTTSAPVGEAPTTTPVGEVPGTTSAPVGEVPGTTSAPVGEVPGTTSAPVGEVPTTTPVGEAPGTTYPVGEAPTTTPVGEAPGTTYPVGAPTSDASGETPSGTPSTPIIPDVPMVLPQCLSTWMFSSECADNTDASCYCKSSEYVCNVFDCLGAHATDAEMAQAQNFFQGICAPYIDVNSAIITCAAPPPAGSPQAPIVPSVPQAVTTIQVYTTIVVPCSESGTAIPGSSTSSVLSTAVTVPQVVFETPAGSSSAALVVGTPAPASVPAGIMTSEIPAAATPAATTFATVVPSNGTAAPTGSTEFTGASSQLSMTFGSLIAALVVSVFIM